MSASSEIPFLAADGCTPAAVDRALHQWGGFLLEARAGELPWREALAAAHALFALPRAEKTPLAVERSPHYRGWSEMHNERDWREQIHFGRERPAAPAASPAFLRLDGPNQWPPAPGWRAAATAYLDAAAALGEEVLAAAAQALGVDGRSFAGVARDGYLLMKMIGYHPQTAGQVARPGVAAHVDFSFLTLTLQDSAGLEVRTHDGRWRLIEPRPGCLWVHAGELLELATGGRYPAAPHRVVNRSSERMRVSIPLFLNPPLAAEVPVLVAATVRTSAPARAEGLVHEHVHRVLPPDAPRAPIHFGEAEWRRKGLNGWCHRCR